MVWYCHLFKNFPQFIVIHTVKCFSVVNESEVDFFFFILVIHTVKCFSVVNESEVDFFLILLLFL